MPVTSIRFSTSRSKPKPKAGDKKMIGGVLHVREFELTPCGALNKTGGRYHYKWVAQHPAESGKDGK